MASHTGHDHPATPAARAACRRGGGAPQAPAEAPQRPVKARTTAGGRIAHPGRAIRNTGDLGGLAVPHRFGTVIRWAWDRGFRVSAGNIYTDNERTVVITSTHGALTLTWRASLPHGVHAVSFRPSGTSIGYKLATVNEGTLALEGSRIRW